MKSENDYLEMQRKQYEKEASLWSLSNKDPVVGSYDEHNSWKDYDDILFKNIDTTSLTALEYGCGPGRNIIKFSSKFKKIDGVDIAKTNLEKAKLNLSVNKIENYNLYHCDGKSIPADDNCYDLIFSVICLQHIASYDIRFSIFKEIYRTLKTGGYFCFQMGYGGKESRFTANYYDNEFDAKSTNGGYDVSVTDPSQLQSDLEQIGFTEYQYDIRDTGPGDDHRNWIWVRVKK